MVTLVHSDNEWLQIVEQAERENKALIVEFSAEWCGPCKRIYPQFERHARESAAATLPVLFVKVDVDQAHQTAQACNVASMPTFQAYHRTTMLGQFTGADQRALAQFVQSISQHMQTTLSADNAFQESGNGAEENNGSNSTVRQADDIFAGRIICVDQDSEWLELVRYARSVNKPIVAFFFVAGDADCEAMYTEFGKHCVERGGAALFAKVNATNASETATAFVGSGNGGGGDADVTKSVPLFLGMYANDAIDLFAGTDVDTLTRLVDNTIAIVPL